MTSGWVIWPFVALGFFNAFVRSGLARWVWKKARRNS
jgi:hypothetical protein